LRTLVHTFGGENEANTYLKRHKEIR